MQICMCHCDWWTTGDLATDWPAATYKMAGLVGVSRVWAASFLLTTFSPVSGREVQLFLECFV